MVYISWTCFPDVTTDVSTLQAISLLFYLIFYSEIELQDKLTIKQNQSILELEFFKETETYPPPIHAYLHRVVQMILQSCQRSGEPSLL